MLKVRRSDENLIDSLLTHISLLEEYYKRAFDKKDERFYGEVAGKLRLLIYESKTCKPLLLTVMTKYNIVVRLDLLNPRNENVDIHEYLSKTCFVFRDTVTNKLYEFTPKDVIITWANQMSAAHEDPELNEDFIKALKQGIFVNGNQAAVEILKRTSNFLLIVCKFVIEDLKKMGKL